jgi:uncharacterized protein with PIN domain
MEDDLDYGKDMTLEELEELEEVDVEFDKNAFRVEGGTCPNCDEKFVKVVENRNIGDWVTLHFDKLRCSKCDKEYFDLEQGKKYSVLLMLEKILRQPMDVLSKKVAGLV